jgi:aspartyl-tRNA(Asn)/glutamyl-tRNA(Gln) amidotransferase subunit A
MTPESMLGFTPFSYPFNLTQQPAITVPCGLTSGASAALPDSAASPGLPIGLQLVGPMFADALVLRAAHAYERLHPAPRPPVEKTVLNPGQHRF